MPNRFLKESICTSENIDQLTDFQEVFFYRLIVNCDDFGRFDARPKLLASRLFPLKAISTEKVEETMTALRAADLLIMYTVKGHPYLQLKTWADHQQARATKSKYPSPDESDCEQLKSSDNNCYQPLSDDSKCHRIRNTYSYNDNDNDNRARAREDAAADDEAHRIAADHNTILDAAEDAGFQKSNSVRARLIDLYAQHGLERVLAGIASCVQHGAPNLAYLTACMRDSPKPQSRLSVVPAQAYGQRDYSGDQQAQIAAMMQGVGDV